MPTRPIKPLTILQVFFGSRRKPMTSERATEILKRNTLYSEVTPQRKPLKEWKRNYASK